MLCTTCGPKEYSTPFSSSSWCLRLLSKAKILVVAPYWPHRLWFIDLRELATESPIPLPMHQDLLPQGPVLYPQVAM